MWDRLSHHCKLRTLQRQLKRTSDSDNIRIEKANKAGADDDALNTLRYEAHNKYLYFDDKIFSLQCRYLIRKAGQYFIPIPPFDESGKWEQSVITGGWQLSPSSYAALRILVEDYEKGRRERIQSWLVVLSGIIGAFTGLVGALIGLIAISS